MKIMERIVDLTMTHLFHMAEYVLDRCPLAAGKPTAPVASVAPVSKQKLTSTIRFSNEDQMVEGDLFK